MGPQKKVSGSPSFPLILCMFIRNEYRFQHFLVYLLYARVNVENFGRPLKTVNSNFSSLQSATGPYKRMYRSNTYKRIQAKDI